MINNSTTPTIKIVLVGDGSSGKTCMIQSYLNDSFNSEYIPTVFDNYKATIQIEEQPFQLALWDTAGQEEYHLLRPLSYAQSDLFMICFSVNDRFSFKNAVKKWHAELQKVAPNTPKMFVGTKIDLQGSENKAQKSRISIAPLSYEEIEKTVDELKVNYLECSALTQEGLKDVFDEAIRVVLRGRKKNKGKVDKKEKDECNIF